MSLRRRLALWYGTTAGTLVALACAYSYALHSRTHYDALDAMLESATAHVATEITGARTREAQRVILHGAEQRGTWVRVYRGNGLAMESGRAAGVPAVDPRAILASGSPRSYGALPSFLGPSHRPQEGAGAFGFAHDSSGRWRVYVLPLNASEQIAAAMPLGRLDASIRSYGRLMLTTALFGSAIAFLVGWSVAARATRPIAVLTQTAGAIARSREFSRRVPGSPHRDELGRLAATFNDMLSSLEQAYAGQQRFVADASHELRAPVTLIQANLELVLRPGVPPAERQIAVEEAYRETTRLGRLVADLLALARADAGMPIRREPVELDRLVMEVLGSTRHLARAHQLTLDALEPSTVLGDPDRLRELLVILLDNAVKYTPAGAGIAVRLERAGPTAVIMVRDQGIGIPLEHLPHVFERFYRVDLGRSRDPGGTGLGLPIAQWIVQQHGGTIELTSQSGDGTTATVRLPISSQSRRERQSHGSGSARADANVAPTGGMSS